MTQRIDGRRFFIGPRDPAVAHTELIVTSEDWHARVAAAADLTFQRVDPRAVVVDETGGREVLFDSNGAAAYGWLMYVIANPEWVGSFRRVDFRRTADYVSTTVIACEDGRTVVFHDDLGRTLEETVTSLERFAAQVGTKAR